MANWTNPNIQQITPLFQSGQALVGGPFAATVGAGVVYTPFTLLNVSQFASYDMNAYMFATTPGAVGSPFNCQVQLLWYDDLVSGIPVFEEDWWVWIGRSAQGPIGTGPGGLNPLCGCGPMHGQYMTMTITTPTVANTGMTIQYLNFFGSNRPLPYSDWRQNTIPIFPQVNNLIYIPPSQEPTLGYDNVLAAVSNFVLANNQYYIPLNLYAGPAFLRYSISATPQNDPTLSVFGGLVGGGPVPGTATPNILLNVPVATTELETTVILPRAAVGFIIRGNAAGSTLSLEVTAQQGA